MKVLSIGSDKNLFVEGSNVRRRILEYGSLVEELHVIVFSKRKLQGRDYVLRVADNIFLYPTNSWSKWFYIFDALKIAKLILKNSDQWLVTAQDPFESGLAGWFIKRKLRIPLQLQIHTDFLSPYFRRESVLNKIRTIIAKFLIPRADCLRVVSQRIKESLKTINYKLKTEPIVLPIFVDAEKIKNSPIKTNLHDKYPQFDFIILMASRLTKEKNISMAIEAMQNITKKYPRAGFVIVGDGPEKENYELLVTSYLLQKNVIFESWSSDLVSYCKTADLFLLTSNYEGYGMAVIEAMIAGCSVIMTDVGLAGELLKNDVNGVVIPVGDKLKLQEAVLRVIENPDLKIMLKENGQKTVISLCSKEEYLKNYQNSWLACFQD
ncbi:MAG: glycosyltransferase family 4 protein [bacterium]|nr:glycosyltransferase family 4 protein [bacterium]